MSNLHPTTRFIGSTLALVWSLGCSASDERSLDLAGSGQGTEAEAGGSLGHTSSTIDAHSALPDFGLGGATTTRNISPSSGGATALSPTGASNNLSRGGAFNSSPKQVNGGSPELPRGGASALDTTTVQGGTIGAGGTRELGKSSSSGVANPGVSPITVWLAGDSTVQNCTNTCPCGWGSQFAAYFNSNVTVKNNAAGGRSIQTWMYEPNVTKTMGANGECNLTETNSARFASTLSDIKAGDYLFIQFGINDGSATCDRHVGKARYQALMTRLAKAVMAKGAHPILLTAVSMISCRDGKAVGSRGFLTETKAAATELGIPVIDLHQLSVDLYNSLKFCPLPAGVTDISASTGGAVGAFFCDDHTHFDTSGAKEIANVVANALRSQNIPLAAYLK